MFDMVDRQNGVPKPPQTERVPLIDELSRQIRGKFQTVKENAQKDPADPVAREDLKKNAEDAGQVLEVILNKHDDERKRRSAEIDELHAILEHWERWRVQNP